VTGINAYDEWQTGDGKSAGEYYMDSFVISVTTGAFIYSVINLPATVGSIIKIAKGLKGLSIGLAQNATTGTLHLVTSGGGIAIADVLVVAKELGIAGGAGYMFARRIDIYGDDAPKSEKIGKPKGNTPGSNKKQNEQADLVQKRLELTDDQRRQLHHATSKQGYGLDELMEIAKAMFGK
jgi:hypothetical protein